MEKMYQRDVYGKALVELGKENKDIVVLDADLSGSTRTSFFAKEFKDRFFNFGVAEQNMMATAAGLASCGKKVFVSTFAMFATGRAWDQVRNSICYNRFNVKIVATHAGLTVGPDGASHQALEDLALMSVIPGMRVVIPCDGPQTKDAIIAAYKNDGPFYVRLSRSKFPSVEDLPGFELGKAQRLKEGKDITICACGIMVDAALKAAEALKSSGIDARVVNVHTLKPIDEQEIIAAASQTKAILVCEEHNIIGGLFSAVSGVVCEKQPARVYSVSVRNRFGQSGEPDELLKKYHLDPADIAELAQKILKD